MSSISSLLQDPYDFLKLYELLTIASEKASPTAARYIYQEQPWRQKPWEGTRFSPTYTPMIPPSHIEASYGTIRYGRKVVCFERFEEVGTGHEVFKKLVKIETLSLYVFQTMIQRATELALQNRLHPDLAYLYALLAKKVEAWTRGADWQMQQSILRIIIVSIRRFFTGTVTPRYLEIVQLKYQPTPLFVTDSDAKELTGHALYDRAASFAQILLSAVRPYPKTTDHNSVNSLSALQAKKIQENIPLSWEEHKKWIWELKAGVHRIKKWNLASEDKWKEYLRINSYQLLEIWENPTIPTTNSPPRRGEVIRKFGLTATGPSVFTEADKIFSQQHIQFQTGVHAGTHALIQSPDAIEDFVRNAGEAFKQLADSANHTETGKMASIQRAHRLYRSPSDPSTRA